MRTIELPDELFEHLQSFAESRGVAPEVLAARYVSDGLAISDPLPTPERVETKGRKDPLPTLILPGRLHFPKMTNAEIFEMLDREEDLAKGRIVE